MPRAAFRFDLSVYSPGCCHPPHSHDQLHLSLALRGRITERVGSTTEHAGALSAVVKDAHRTGFSDQPHLCRAFGKATGLTPGHYSRLVSRIQGSAQRTV